MQKILNIFILIAITISIYGCGSQDYGEDAPPKPTPEGVVTGWRENALAQRNRTPDLTKGSQSEIVEAFSGIPESSQCPTDTLCLRSPFFGEEQLSMLAISNPKIVRLEGKESQRHYILSAKTTVIESDLFLLGEGTVLRFCGKDFTTVSSEISGGGKIDGSACSDEYKNGANINLLAATAKDMEVLTNGRDGKSLEESSQIKDGNPKAVSIEVEMNKAPIHLCVDGPGCVRHILNTYKSNKKEGWDIYADMVEEATFIAKKNRDFLGRVGFPVDNFEQWSLDAFKSFDGEKDPQLAISIFFGGGGCHLVSDPSINRRHTGLVKEMNPIVKGLEGLNGKDSDPNENRIKELSGGDSGKIQVYAREIKASRVEARFGKAAKPGESGRGAVPKNLSKEVSYKFYGHFSCELTPDDKGNVRVYYQQLLEPEVKKTFRLGEKYACNLEEKYGPVLGDGYLDDDGEVKGKDGKKVVAGVDGRAIEPALIQTPINEVVINKMREVCSTCEQPKALQ